MKKLLLIAMVMLGVAFTSNAQNANRSGFFLELSPGIYVGNTPVVDITTGQTFVGDKYVTTKTTKYLSGFNIEFDAGYRWAFYRHWALDAKIGFWMPTTSDIIKNSSFEILPGLRYTSKEFKNSNISFFAGFNAGLGFNCSSFGHLGIAYELKAGLNITNKFSIGLIWNAMTAIGKSYIDYYYYANRTHTGALGINLGYRF